MDSKIEGSRRSLALMRQTLQEDEDLVEIVRLKWVKLIRPGLVFLALFLAALVVLALLPLSFVIRATTSVVILLFGVGFFTYHWLYWKDEFMIITSKRVVLEKGVLSRSTREIPLNKINDVSCQQSLFGRMFHYGNIEIASANVKGPEKIHCIPEPLAIRSLIATVSTKEPAKKQAPENVVPPSPKTGSSFVDDLERLTVLYQQGMITTSEFQAAKDMLLQMAPHPSEFGLS